MCEYETVSHLWIEFQTFANRTGETQTFSLRMHENWIKRVRVRARKEHTAKASELNFVSRVGKWMHTAWHSQ